MITYGRVGSGNLHRIFDLYEGDRMIEVRPSYIDIMGINPWANGRPIQLACVSTVRYTKPTGDRMRFRTIGFLSDTNN